MSVEKLKKMIRPINEKSISENDWDSVQNEYDIKLPSDYKDMISTYGAGAINDFLWIFSPFSINENLNLLKRIDEIKNSYEYMKDEFPDKEWLSFYNGESGIFPWGITDNGDELFLNYTNRGISIVVYESRYSKMNEYDLNISEFLVKVLNGELYCDIFPDDFVLEENYFNAVN